jgi:hypothetical protein
MPWRITKTIDGDHVGETLEHVEKGQIITFPDGDVVPIEQVFLSDDGLQMMATGNHYTMNLIKE